MNTLSSLKPGEKGLIKNIDGKSSLKRRLYDVGLCDGGSVTCLTKSIFGGISAYLIRDAVIAIRKEDAQLIYIEKAAG